MWRKQRVTNGHSLCVLGVARDSNGARQLCLLFMTATNSNPAGLGFNRELASTKYCGWNAIVLRQGPLELYIVPQIGGRLMGIRYCGQELCFINPGLAGVIPQLDGQPWQELCQEWAFPLWGGGKTWVAPESEWPGGAPQRDLDSGPYRVLHTWVEPTAMGVEMESSVCRQSGLQIRRRIELRAGKNSWTVLHGLTNRSVTARRCGIWDVLMFRRPGIVTVLLDRGANVHGHDAVRIHEEKCSAKTVRSAGLLASDPAKVRVRCEQALQYKLGFEHVTGEIWVDLPMAQGVCRYRRFCEVSLAARYAHRQPVEVFNAPKLPYLEIETHGAYCRLAPGESVEYSVEEKVFSI